MRLFKLSKEQIVVQIVTVYKYCSKQKQIQLCILLDFISKADKVRTSKERSSKSHRGTRKHADSHVEDDLQCVCLFGVTIAASRELDAINMQAHELNT